MSEILSPPHPFYIPGYAGYIPRAKYMCGDTIGHVSHKVLMDRSVKMAERMVLSDQTIDSSRAQRPLPADIETLRDRRINDDPIYGYPMTPGYGGFIPRMLLKLGQRYTVAATEALSDFERSQQNNKEEKGKQISTSRYPLPLRKVNPQAAGVARDLKTPQSAHPLKAISPYFSDYNDPRKYFKQGFCGFVPFSQEKCGMTSKAMNIEALTEFTRTYRRHLSNYWSPFVLEEHKDTREHPTSRIEPTVIYHKDRGMVPYYTGHIPGAQFRHGKTIGKDSINAKRWLEGDFSF